MQTVAGLGLAGLAGLLASHAGMPLAWILAPLIVSAGLALVPFGGPLPAPVFRAGQIGVGTSLGLGMSAASLESVVAYVPLMIATALFSITVSAALSVLLARLAGIDPRTAFFASLPGGLVEMGSIGAQVGADPEPIAVVQTLRVVLIVLIVPPALVAFSVAPAAPSEIAPAVPTALVPVLLAAAILGALSARLVGLNNPFILGPLIVMAALIVSGLVAGRMPPALFAATQFVVGFSLGYRFRRAVMFKLPAVAMAGAAQILLFTALLVGYSLLIASVSGLDPATAILATSIGGASEGAITAQILHLDVSLIIAFQMMRAFLVNGFATYYWTFFSRTGFFSLFWRMFGGADGTFDR